MGRLWCYLFGGHEDILDFDFARRGHLCVKCINCLRRSKGIQVIIDDNVQSAS